VAILSVKALASRFHSPPMTNSTRRDALRQFEMDRASQADTAFCGRNLESISVTLSRNVASTGLGLKSVSTLGPSS